MTLGLKNKSREPEKVLFLILKKGARFEENHRKKA
nr:MAG TPA: hypothetical protein [Caudoviricetes sp.]DAQ77082.1 MAG TPA: hypothetical protein [Caudoviricetes sp.]DAR80007.1 MAG TPA: hypothetical protein [Caudoviricetes sp.]DAS31312.1 MAG TPA: hypothetical protein [Caudoviricetes sp.]